MDRGHELAFINQNFQNIANVLGNAAFTIVSSGTVTTTTTSTTDGGAGIWSDASNSVSATHNLGYIPTVIAFISQSGLYVPLPYLANVKVTTTAVYFATIIPYVSSSVVTFTSSLVSLHTAATITAADIKYYLLQPSAN